MTDQPSEKPRLLSGGNPQIPKGDGDEPVRAYIAAMPGWKHAVGHHLDDLVVRTVPNVRKAVRWNSPFYGVEGNGWFLPYLDIHEDEELDEQLVASWIRQAADLPGEDLF